RDLAQVVDHRVERRVLEVERDLDVVELALVFALRVVLGERRAARERQSRHDSESLHKPLLYFPIALSQACLSLPKSFRVSWRRNRRASSPSSGESRRSTTAGRGNSISSFFTISSAWRWMSTFVECSSVT